MAPELLTKGDVSAKCDVYSYAIILWEMLTASHPFRGLDIFQVCYFYYLFLDLLTWLVGWFDYLL